MQPTFALTLSRSLNKLRTKLYCGPAQAHAQRQRHTCLAMPGEPATLHATSQCSQHRI